MHELSLCQALISEVEAVARREDAQRVLSVMVRIGPLSGVEPELLHSAYTLARCNTVAADSRLLIESMPVCVTCEDCGSDSTVAHNRLLCADCGSWHTRVISGDELMLMRVELERNNVH